MPDADESQYDGTTEGDLQETDDLEEIVDAETGETVLVDPEEAKRMGLRQQDYTRKTQRVAPISRLMDLAELDPVAAVNAFQQMLVDEGKLRFAEPDDEDDERHPFERDLDEIRALMHQREQETRAEKLEVAMVKAIGSHEELKGLEADDLFDFMVESDIGNPAIAAELLATRVGSTARKSKQTDAIAAKRTAAVHSGASRATPVPSQKIESFADAYKAAMAELNVS